jgi:murein DD-endopeptidase MepM/ murein hydrolase activator NlpD
MKTILTIFFTMSFLGNAFALECTLPLCKNIQKRSAMFKEMDSWDSYKTPRKYTVTKISFTPPSRPKPTKRRVKTKLLWPLKSGRISSKFGYRKNPFNGKRQHHNGLDIAAPTGRLIRASADGVVTRSGRITNGCGYGVYIQHGRYETIYCHASKVLVKKGDRVKRGQGIAKVGSTGHSTGPHLHFEVRKNKKSYNPLKFLG